MRFKNHFLDCVSCVLCTNTYEKLIAYGLLQKKHCFIWQNSFLVDQKINSFITVLHEISLYYRISLTLKFQEQLFSEAPRNGCLY